jgi:hypothetical protein
MTPEPRYAFSKESQKQGVVCGEQFDLRGMKWQEAGEDSIVRSYITCTFHQMLLE